MENPLSPTHPVLNPLSTKALFESAIEQIGKIFVGQDELVANTLIALFSGGMFSSKVCRARKDPVCSDAGQSPRLSIRENPIHCRPHAIGYHGAPIFDMKTQEFRFRPGPVFTQLLLTDEINRAPAKTHAALLEIMQEFRVTVDGTSHPVPRPFLVLATQNPIESEGTYSLPEAQLDRFMFKSLVQYPEVEEEARILELHSRQVDLTAMIESEVKQVATPETILASIQSNALVRMEPKLVRYINAIVRKTREWPTFHMGASPRAGLALMQGARTLAAFRGRDFAVPDDIVEIALPALRHRVVLSAEAEVEGQKVDEQLQQLIRSIEVPRM